jgi:sensor histidine kinase YesM
MFPPHQIQEAFPGFILFVLFFTFIILAFSYLTVYVLVAQLLQKKKYFLFAICLPALIIFMIGLILAYNFSGINKTYNQITGIHPGVMIQSATLRFFGNPPLVCGLLLSLKSLKNWQLKQQEKETLIKENINAELQLLKAQVHPHFLFNTLNNIYSYSLNKSPEAPKLVKKLKDTIQYMITECDAPLVSFERELTMIRDYMDLEKVRYGNRLNLQVEIEGDYFDKLIAPLLMIPFVENAFKHGASRMLENPWVKLKIIIDKNVLYLHISNNKSTQAVNLKNKSGIGLKNVEKRLQLLYPHEYTLHIESADDTFSVKMQLPLKTDFAVIRNNLLKTKKMQVP